MGGGHLRVDVIPGMFIFAPRASARHGASALADSSADLCTVDCGAWCFSIPSGPDRLEYNKLYYNKARVQQVVLQQVVLETNPSFLLLEIQCWIRHDFKHTYRLPSCCLRSLMVVVQASPQPLS
jgi:hypothetical protein